MLQHHMPSPAGMAIDKVAADSSGAPKHCGRSGMGKQADSKKKTAPAHSFSHMADREAASKTFLSAAHNNVELRCRGSPGAIYSVRSSIDTQADKATAPKFTFNKTERLKVPLSRPVCVWLPVPVPVSASVLSVFLHMQAGC